MILDKLFLKSIPVFFVIVDSVETDLIAIHFHPRSPFVPCNLSTRCNQWTCCIVTLLTEIRVTCSCLPSRFNSSMAYFISFGFSFFFTGLFWLNHRCRIIWPQRPRKKSFYKLLTMLPLIISNTNSNTPFDVLILLHVSTFEHFVHQLFCRKIYTLVYNCDIF